MPAFRPDQVGNLLEGTWLDFADDVQVVTHARLRSGRAGGA